MAVITWRKGLNINQDPDATRDYTIDLTRWLQGSTLATVVLTQHRCTASIRSQESPTVVVRVAGVQSKSWIMLRLTTTDGRVDNRTINFTPDQM